MRTTGLLLLFISILSFNSSTAQGIEFFHGTWKEALVEAEKDDKLVFVDAYAKWCGPCKRMAKDVFTKAEVGQFYNENFINLKLDMEEMDGVTFGHEYPVSAYPTLIFLNHKGELIKKSTGGKQVAGLIELGKTAILSYDKTEDFAILYEEGNRDFDLMVNYVKCSRTHFDRHHCHFSIRMQGEKARCRTKCRKRRATAQPHNVRKEGVTAHAEAFSNMTRHSRTQIPRACTDEQCIEFLRIHCSLVQSLC